MFGSAASESLVLSALRELMRGKTTVMIAHNLASVQHADVVFALVSLAAFVGLTFAAGYVLGKILL